MTAASAYPPGPDQGSAEGRAPEPSMEDILASIRRIIADDQQSSGTRRRAQPAPPVAVPAAPDEPARRDHDDVLDLAHYARGAVTPGEAEHHFTAEPPRSLDHEPPPAASFVAEPPAGPVGDGAAAPAAHADEEAYATSDAYEAGEEQRNLALLAPPMSESVMSAFEALAATVVLENKPMLEGILRDLLRPMLKAWLDDNLPALVERLVRIEIERVARGGRH